MLILHAGFDEGYLLLWGEAKTSPPPPGRRLRVRAERPNPSPFDAGEERLAEALTRGGWPLPSAFKDNTGWVEAWLPTFANRPVPSSPLIADPPASTDGIDLFPWTVTALALEAEEAIPILSSLSGDKLLGAGLVAGRDLRFWATALRFAGSLVARQRFLPGVIRDEYGVHGRWTTCLGEEEARRLSTLATAMPGASRALTLTSGKRPEVPPRQVLEQFVNRVADHLVRSSGASELPAPARKPSSRRKSAASVNPHADWMASLASANDEIPVESTVLEELRQQVQAWHRPVTVISSSPFRLCFRLEEPGEDESTWYLRFLLRSVADPSLLLPTDEAWSGRGPQAALFKKENFAAREYLLTTLGQAASLVALVERGLRDQAPAGVTLDAAEAHRFLTESAFFLEENGFGVLLPGWWTGRGKRQRLRLRAKVKSSKLQGGSGLTLNEVVRFNWAVALGGEELTYRELMALAKLKTPLVRVRGEWVEVNPEEMREALAFWKKRQEGSATVREILRMAIGAETVSPTLELEQVQADGWVGELLDRLEGRQGLEILPLPDGFHGTLRPYQERGFAWLDFLGGLGLGACLADDMGLGKTVQTLALVRRLRTNGTHAPVLLVCPTSVMGNWQKEIARFTPGLTALVHHGGGRHGAETFADEAAKHDLVISSYALLHRDQEHLQGVNWAGVILDEAQNVKNPETRQAKAARALAAGFRIALTGTPVENNVGDLWSLMEFLNPGFLGGQSQFRKSFFVPIQTRRDQAAMTRLKRITGPFILRRLKTDPTIISDLPDKLEMKVFCNLTKEQATLYAAVVEEAGRQIAAAEGIQRRGVILATLSKLKQVCNHPAHFLGDKSALAERSGKLSRLTEMLEEIRSVGERALLFTQFAEMGTLLQAHLQETFGEEALFLHGGVAKPRRDRLVERFQSSDGPRVFILSLKAGGTGLNLTGANHVFHFDRWWNPAVENQATDRAFRIGQTKNVQVHKFLCVGTLEEKIDEMIESKRQVAEEVVGTGEGWLTEMSDTQLRELFALRREALEEA